MVVHDEETLNEALLLVDSGPVRYDDEYAYVIITNRGTLESMSRSALGRGSIAIVVPRGAESEMEDHPSELRKVKARRKKEEQKDVRGYFREHPEKVEKVARQIKKEDE